MASPLRGTGEDFIEPGYNSVDWAEIFVKNKNIICPNGACNSFSRTDLKNLGLGSVQSDAPELRPEPSDEEWEHFDAAGHLDTDNVFILLDCMNSGMPIRGAGSGARSDDYVRARRDAYRKLFQMARHKFQKLIYVPRIYIRKSFSGDCFS